VLKSTAEKEIKKAPQVCNLVSINEYREKKDKMVVADFIFDLDAPVKKETGLVALEDIKKIHEDSVILYKHLAVFLPPEAMEIYFSGRRGFSIVVKKEALGLIPNEKINFYFKQIVMKINDEIGIDADAHIYGDGKLIRVPNSLHGATRLHRICLSPSELFNLTVEKIIELAAKPRKFTEFYAGETRRPSEDGCKYFQGMVENIKYIDYSRIIEADREIKNLEKDPACIADLLGNGIKKSGERNPANMVLATYFKDKGKSLAETIRICQDWGKKIPDHLTGTHGAARLSSIASCVKAVYESKGKEYAFSCLCAKALSDIFCNKIKCPLFKTQEIALYKKIPGIGMVREGAQGYEIFISGGGETEKSRWEPINNFLIKYDRIIKSSEEISYVGRIVIDGKLEYPFAFEPEILSDNQKFRKELVSMGATGIYYSPKDLQGILMLANYFGDKAKKVEGLDSVGARGAAFITPSFYIKDSKIEKNTEFPIINSKTRIDRYDFLSAPLENCTEGAEFILNKLINLHSRNITLPLLGEVGRCPIINEIGNMRYITYIEGITGAGKSMIQKAFLNFYFPISLEEKRTEFKQQAMATMSDTSNRIEFHGYFLVNVPFVWDDFKTGLTKNSSSVIQVIQNYYNQGGRGRMTKEIKERRSYYIRANLWANGEQIPEGYASALERCLIYRVEKSGLDLSLLGEIEEKRELLRSITPWYIAWVQKNGVEYWKGNFDIEHARLVPYGRQNLTGLKSILAFFRDMKWLSEIRANELMKEGEKAIENAINLTKIGSEEETSVSSFIGGLRELLVSGKCVLGPSFEIEADKFSRNNAAKEVIGENNEGEETIFIFPRKAVEQVIRLYSNKIKFSAGSLGRDLLEENFLVEKRKDGSPSVVKRLRHGVATVWVFSRKKLLEEMEGEKEPLKDDTSSLFT